MDYPIKYDISEEARIRREIFNKSYQDYLDCLNNPKFVHKYDGRPGYYTTDLEYIGFKENG